MSDYKLYHELYGIPRSVKNEMLEATSRGGEYYIRRKQWSLFRWLRSLFKH